MSHWLIERLHPVRNTKVFNRVPWRGSDCKYKKMRKVGLAAIGYIGINELSFFSFFQACISHFKKLAS